MLLHTLLYLTYMYLIKLNNYYTIPGLPQTSVLPNRNM